MYPGPGQSSALVPKGHHHPPPRLWAKYQGEIAFSFATIEGKRIVRFQSVMMDSQCFLSTLKFIDFGMRSYNNQWTIPWWSYLRKDTNLGRLGSYIDNGSKITEYLKDFEAIIPLFAQLSSANLIPSNWASERLWDRVLSQVGRSWAVWLLNPSIKSMGCITSLPNINMLAEKPVDLFFMECKAMDMRGRCSSQSFRPLEK